VSCGWEWLEEEMGALAPDRVGPGWHMCKLMCLCGWMGVMVGKEHALG
jgi:hypothetical protein